jgi:hypothetical protein
MSALADKVTDVSDELGQAIAKAMRAWARQQDVLGKVAADERPLHVQLGKPPAIVFRVTNGEAMTVYLSGRCNTMKPFTLAAK